LSWIHKDTASDVFMVVIFIIVDQINKNFMWTWKIELNEVLSFSEPGQDVAG